MMVAIFVFPFFVWSLLWRNLGKLKEENSVKRFGSTFAEIKTDSRAALMYNVLYMLRRLLFAVIATVFEDHPVL
jgi:hypothetical protein